jgi:hypothetical protein
VTLPTDPQGRKDTPIVTGVLDYFGDAIAEVARVSKIGNDQHHAGAPLHWDKSKSTDEADALVRHLMERGTRDVDGTRHTAKVAWRALALLQRELEAEAVAIDSWTRPRDDVHARAGQSANEPLCADRCEGELNGARWCNHCARRVTYDDLYTAYEAASEWDC